MLRQINYVVLIVVSSAVVLCLVVIGLRTDILKNLDSIIVVVAVGIALNVIAQFIYNAAQAGTEAKALTIHPAIEARINEIRSYEFLESVTLDSIRKKEIVCQACTVFPYIVAIRKRHLAGIKKHLEQELKGSRSEVMTKPAWSSISSTHSPAGYRFVMGFKNVGCAYWRNDPFQLGCLSCGFCSGVAPDIEPTREELEMQFENALGEALETRIDFDVIEFLNDGSFFNDEEFDPDFRKYLFRKVNSLPYVRRILVETRPEYVNKDSISAAFDELAQNKSLEVGIGLETADEFIRAACHRKGFYKRDFENAIDCLSSLDGRIGAVAYSLVKPSFLTEVEAIEDEINTAQYLAELSNYYSCGITLKLEPTVVAKGTLLDFLYFQGERKVGIGYSILSYWSIIEILCRLAKEGVEIPVRIGAREDMDIIEKVPAVYDTSGMFNKWDFILYEAVQRFNVHRSLEYLLSEIDDALSDKSFDDWKVRLGLHNTAIEECRESLRDAIEGVKNENEERSRRAFLMKLFAALDRIEYGERSVQFAIQQYRQRRRRSPKERGYIVQNFVESEFREVMKDFWLRVREVRFEKDGLRLARVYFQIRDLKQKDALYNVWAGIPTKQA